MWQLLTRLRFVRRRETWVPTWAGWLILAGLTLLPVFWWSFRGESFLSATNRLSAEVLVVESWIGTDGIRAAADEYVRGHYKYIVPTGALDSSRWEEAPKKLALIAQRELLNAGIPQEYILVAPAKFTDSGRTYESALAVKETLQNHGIRPQALNVFTLGPHARRSGLVFSKVNGSTADVGVVGWTPPDYGTEWWWQSSERAKEFVLESIGYAFESLFNSGRHSSSPKNG
jgi:uncharacterized SAM-binding protein YcdF (DUF218 family)